MSYYLSKHDLANGVEGLPKLTLLQQQNLRAKKRISYVVIAHKVYYKREWIEDYINSNTKEAKK